MLDHSNKQLLINLASQFASFLVQFSISFFLTPYIVKSLGAESYGFIGLGQNLIEYTTLITIALNSMASRFITINLVQGNLAQANKYFSSVFICNFIITIFLLTISILFINYVDLIINIPKHLIIDVKILFLLLIINSCIGLITNIFAIATFARNRLELNSIRTIVANIGKAISLLLMFTLFSPKIWFLGISGILFTLYVSLTNYKYTKRLTPELSIKKNNFDKSSLKILLSSGVWNLISKLSLILSQGFDLLLANLFISASAMGLLSITKIIPIIILNIFASLSICFAPKYTELYAKGKLKDLKMELLKSIKILTFLASFPLSILYGYGSYFYKLWMPEENHFLLYIITSITTIELIFALPLEGLWNIFTITNNVKKSSFYLLLCSVITIIIVITSIHFIESDITKLYIIAGTRSIIGLIRSISFLPIYGAKLLSYPYNTFYKPIITNILVVLALSGLSKLFSNYISPNNWIQLLICIFTTIIFGLIINYFLVLSSSDKTLLKARLKSYL